MNQQTDLFPTAGQFQIYGDYLGAAPYGSGHINDTYVAHFSVAGTPVRYIFQRINTSIFRNPEGLMDNVQRVTTHIASRLRTREEGEVSRKVLTLVPTRDGASFLRDANDDYWRAYLFVERATTYDAIETPAHALEAARAFGNFQHLLSDLPGPRLVETIPDFHHAGKRLQALERAIDEDSAGRVEACRPEIDFMLKRRQFASILPDLVAKGEIPERITHNDTKLNNVLIDDETDRGVCVIDLDTVMPGLAHYDFGDMVRTATSPVAEDEPDASRVVMQMPMFEALARGFLETAGQVLNDREVEYLVFGGKLLTFIIGVRFLTDYLMGDQYFKVHRENHNLDRCRTQVALIRSIEEQEDEMQALVQRIRGELG